MPSWPLSHTPFEACSGMKYPIEEGPLGPIDAILAALSGANKAGKSVGAILPSAYHVPPSCPQERCLAGSPFRSPTLLCSTQLCYLCFANIASSVHQLAVSCLLGSS